MALFTVAFKYFSIMRRMILFKGGSLSFLKAGSHNYRILRASCLLNRSKSTQREEKTSAADPSWFSH